ncbi:MAG TPA: FecR domain-containing protein [Spirochaetota bacterium]|nr:FecR domain-containing protein [Spirochaetota bacterium]HPC42932.1 FecR domain-containing protein [Spirochaetota bacterium]HPL18971.1 FecR domain-containing protein [Spirochaetota bacterium]HQF07652.1 FecR domain-containing protein [Spirochaetota bacterium]HQH96384.1 FecR domain-containing protein [Spirochaetota bacterium]
MKLSKREYIYFSIAALIICAFSLLFYLDFTGRSAIGQERIVGSIVFKKNMAQRKYSGQVVWDEIELTAPVYNNDSIRTAERSQAVVRLFDGSEITINENSMVQLSFVTDEIDIQFKEGSISTRRGVIAGETPSRMNIRTEDATVSVARSDVQLTGSKDKGVSLFVSRGDATVTTGLKERSVTENQKVIVEKGSRDVRIFTIPLKPLNPLPDAVLITTGDSGAVAFTWEALKPGQEGFLDISDTVVFSRTVATRKIVGTGATVNVPVGSYFWRLRAKNRINGAVDTGEGRRFSLVRVEPAYLIAPEQGQIIQYGKTRPVINFKWNGSEITREYDLEIASDSAMSRIVGTFKTADGSMAVDNFDEGTYFWRVVSVTGVSGNLSRVPSPVRMLKILRKKIIDPPMPQFPPDESSISAVVMKEKGIVFSWLNDQDIQSVRITISRNPDFSKPVFSGVSNANFMNIRRELDAGTYYWKLQGILGGGRLTRSSQAATFTMVTGQTIRLMYPGENSGITPAGKNKDVKMSWEQTDIYGEYLVQVAVNNAFTRIYKEKQVTAHDAVISGFSPGKYYWRVMLKNNDGSIVMTSKSSSFVVLDAMPEPTILSPANGETIDMDRRDELDLRWKRIEEANAYRFRMYRFDGKKETMIAERLIRGTNYDLNSIDFPGDGEYRWSIQALEMSRDGSNIIRKSPLCLSRFTIQATAVPKKIRIITPKVIYVE